MKKRIFTGLKIYFISLIFVFLLCFIYAFYLLKSGNNSSKIIEISIGSISFILLGLLYSNSIHKRGLIVGLLVGLIHISLISLLIFLTEGNYNFKIIPSITYVFSSSLGGTLGILFKKII